MGMVKIVIFGSTKDEIHIGCKALMNGLENLIKEKHGNNTLIQNVSHRFLSEFFCKSYCLELPIKERKSIFSSTKGKLSNSQSDYEKWLRAYNEMSSKDNFLNLTIKNADFVIINVEGIIHHKSLLGHQMLAIGKMASELGKEVHWVNFSTQGENESILKDALENATKITAREVRSFDYLKLLGIKVALGFDTAILASFTNDNSLSINDGTNEYCIFTGSNVKSIDLIETANIIRDKGFEPIYLPMGLNDYKDLKKIKQSNVKCFDFQEIPFIDIKTVLEKSKFVVSGRHHMNIFSILSGKPFIPFKSNTWKIDGVCNMIDYEIDFELGLSERIDKTVDNYNDISNNFNKSISNLIELSKNNL